MVPPVEQAIPPTLADIARRLGLDKSTVAKALRDHPRIAAATKARVRADAAALGYRPDPAIRRLAQHRWKRRRTAHDEVAILWQGTHAPFMDPRAVHDMKSRLAELGYAAAEVPCTPATVVSVCKRLHHRGVEGILAGPVDLGSMAPVLGDGRFSVVALLTGPLPVRFHAVRPDPAHAVTEAWQRVRAAGLRRPGLVVFDELAHADEVFRSGAFQYWQSVWGEPPHPAILRMPVVPLQDPEAARRVGRLLEAWRLAHRPDCILGLNDYVYWTWRAGSRRPPPPFISLNTDSLGRIAGILVRWDLVGRAAVELLDQQLRHREFGTPDPPHLRLVPGAWVDGDTFPASG